MDISKDCSDFVLDYIIFLGVHSLNKNEIPQYAITTCKMAVLSGCPTRIALNPMDTIKDSGKISTCTM